MNIFKNILNRKSKVTVNLEENVKLTVIPVCGGIYAVLYKYDGIFTRQEHAYFATLSDLCDSLRLTDDRIIRKLSKAF